MDRCYSKIQFYYFTVTNKIDIRTLTDFRIKMSDWINLKQSLRLISLHIYTVWMTDRTFDTFN